MNAQNTLYTIGYTAYPMDVFLEKLTSLGITALADVRSSPYSAYYKEFNKEVLADALATQRISYVPLGDALGARQSAPSVYIDGRADYERIACLPSFREGLARLQKGLEKHSIVLLCAEKDPITCHRALLICQHMRDVCRIAHIWPHEEHGSMIDVEPHSRFEQRLMYRHNGGQLSLLARPAEQLVAAYRKQGHEMAFYAQNSEDVAD